VSATFAWVSAAAAIVAAGAACAAPRYIAEPLGALGGAYSEGRAINARGEVTGAAQVASGELHAFLFAGGNMRDLDDASTGSVGNAINLHGHVTGCVTRSDGTHGFVHHGDVMRDIDTLVVSSPTRPLPTRLGCGVAIDDADRVVGPQYWDFQYAPAPSYRYAAGVVEDIGQTVAALNNRGDIAGTAYFHVNPPQGWVIVDGVRYIVGAASGAETYVTAINASGHATGSRHVASVTANAARYLPFDFATGVETPIVAFPPGDSAFGKAINAWGHIVGEGLRADATAYAFVAIGGEVSDLNALVASGLDGSRLTTATAINDAGIIVANSCPPAPSYPPPCVAFRLIPLDDAASPANVPALSMRALVLLGLLLVATTAMQLRR